MKIEIARRVVEAGAAAAGIVVWRALNTRRQAGEYNKLLASGGITRDQKAALFAGLPGRVAKRIAA
jgi:hypothetical protein